MLLVKKISTLNGIVGDLFISWHNMRHFVYFMAQLETHFIKMKKLEIFYTNGTTVDFYIPSYS
jgi:hypothetical protein